ncbi:hypothetical protein HYPSUDRAFT_52570 [Hypholoma sublateritium FD-334 SS-4]|uniref:Cytochrome P450 n=1 Tax=Hypholoma sublateritium (strain FD-334 SS-4) TaxID=945553 RepID=A0A0D2LF97_HYPSF|nr:hypothetical protein HYPSUDRAFT_52570 [Hypholoma sublateritium FD-334 SS-4]
MAFLAACPQLDALLDIAAVGVCVHYIFKKTETHEPLLFLPLIFGVPAILTKFYHPRAAGLLSTIVIVSGTFWASLLASIGIYRLSPWHPLAKYPGPILCKLSKFRLAYLCAQGKQHMDYQTLHEKYGDVVRVGPNEISICNVDAVNPLMGSLGLPKGQFWEGRIDEAEAIKPLVAIRDKTEHARRRRPWTRAFSTSALKGYEDLVIKRSTQLVDAIASKSNPVDLTRWVSYFTYDIMSDLAFGGGSEMLAQGDSSGLWHLLENGQKNAIVMAQVPWLGKLLLRYPLFAGGIKAFRAYGRNRALLRKKMGSSHKDIFHHLIDEDGVFSQPPSVAEIASDGSLAIIAGSDTTSSAIANLLYFLMTHPTPCKRLQAEVDELGDDLYDCTKQAHLPYLTAAINESLRLLPPILSGSQRQGEKGSGGKLLGSYYLPEGNSAFIPTYALQRDPRYFSPFADRFIPERWLSEDKRMELEPKIFGNGNFVLNTTAFIPFSTGPANCVGKNLAWMEMRMVIVLIMRRLDIRLEDGYNPQRWSSDIKDQFVTMKGVLPTMLTLRKAA